MHPKREKSPLSHSFFLFYTTPTPPNHHYHPPTPPPPHPRCVKVKGSHFPPGGSEKLRWHIRWPQGGMCRRVHVSTNSQKAELGVPVSKYGSTSCVSHGRWHTSPAGCGSLPLLERPLRNENENSPENLPECDSLRRKASRSRELRYAKLNIT